jgi:hypothetical protein
VIRPDAITAPWISANLPGGFEGRRAWTPANKFQPYNFVGLFHVLIFRHRIANASHIYNYLIKQKRPALQGRELMTGVPSFLPDGKSPDKSAWMSIDKMSRCFDIGRTWINARIVTARFEPVLAEHSLKPELKPVAYYSPECCEFIRVAALKWHSTPPLGDYITLQNAENELGASRAWIMGALKRHKLPKPVKRRSQNNRIVLAIPSRSMTKLAAIRMQGISENMMSASEISRLTGWHSVTIQRRLGKVGIQPTMAISTRSGHVCPHYSAAVLEILGNRPKAIPYAGANLTAHRISRMLGRTPEWTRRRISLPKYRQQAKLRLTDMMEPCLHYPYSVYLDLKRESDSARYPRAPKKWMTATDIFNEIKGSRKVLLEVLEQEEIHKHSELRTSHSRAHRVYRYYPPSAIALAVDTIHSQRKKRRSDSRIAA